MITCSIVYASMHTNARRLSESMLGALDPGQCIYAGLPDDRAFDADVLFWGGNTDTQTAQIQNFLEKAKQKEQQRKPSKDQGNKGKRTNGKRDDKQHKS